MLSSMGRALRLLAPYLLAVVGTAAVTGLIAALRPWIELPNLAVAYLLLVMGLGARYGWPPAVFGALLAFFAYNWFLVPPYYTLYISAPRDLVNLVVLVAAALIGGRLVAALAERSASAAASALESGILYELATAALHEPAGTSALALLCDRATATGGLVSMTLLAIDGGHAEVVAGAPPTPDELAQAAEAAEKGLGVGARLRNGQLEVTRTFPAAPRSAFVPLSGGTAVLRVPAGRLPADKRHLLAAMLGLAGLLLDRRRAATATQRARLLEASDRLKAAVLSSMSHELKSPLSSLRTGLTALLLPESGLRAEERELVAGLDSQVTRLDRLVGDLLTLSRLEAGLPPDRAPHDLGELIGTVLRDLRPTLADFDVQTHLPGTLPPVLADELQVERVLTNLLENAAEWTPAHGRIGIGAGERGGVVEVWIENAGAPIPPADLEHVFDKFWTGRRRGSGLGLAIARRVIEAHGGQIRVENRAKGPRFVFQLPLAAPPRRTAHAPPREAAQSRAAPHQSPQPPSRP
jgi:two-component system sensor histidine kinase KdpD